MNASALGQLLRGDGSSDLSALTDTFASLIISDDSLQGLSPADSFQEGLKVDVRPGVRPFSVSLPKGSPLASVQTALRPLRPPPPPKPWEDQLLSMVQVPDASQPSGSPSHGPQTAAGSSTSDPAAVPASQVGSRKRGRAVQRRHMSDSLIKEKSDEAILAHVQATVERYKA